MGKQKENDWKDPGAKQGLDLLSSENRPLSPPSDTEVQEPLYQALEGLEPLHPLNGGAGTSVSSDWRG